MLILNIITTLKLSSSVILKNRFSTKITKNRDLVFRESKTKLFSNEKLNECMKYGISLDNIHKNEWIFNLSLNQLSCGLDLLQKWNPKQMDDLFVLLRMSTNKLAHFTRKSISESKIIPHGNRVYYFAENLERDPMEVCYHLIRYQFLFSRHFPTLHQIYNILIENNVNKNDIWNDVWVFMYSIDQINQRISIIKMSNVVIKPWMLRCKPEVFERTIEIKQENRVVLNKDSTAQYLAKRLKVPEKTIRYISSKYPTTLRVSPTKLKEILDFLLKEGYRPSEILSIPRIFTHSISTLKERLNELRDLGNKPTLTALCKNKTTYQELVNKLIMKNNKQFNKY